MKHESFASNPLLLNIMLLTYDNYADIPEKLHLFYSNAFETLYIKHDATKGGYKREFKTKLSSDDFKRVFAFFCFVTYFNGKIEFYEDELRSFLAKVNLKGKELNIDDIIYDLTNSMCLMYKDGITYRFTHRSFQEYFTALFLKELPDSNMKKMAIELIKKDPIRARDDSVFDMLYDMCEERVEHNIIMPILEEIETDCENDKYKYYLERMNVEFKLSTSPEANDITLWLLMFEGCQLSWFVYKFVKIHNKTPQELEDAKKFQVNY
ncbi:MAG: hypothetical protein E7555_08880 [Ruminococcaceae bacterium]|nr:hypothetical protein [Oscillospiraceae bacterium]